MKGLLACAKWELLWQWRQVRSGGKWVLFELIWLPVYALLMARNASDRWLLLLWSGLVPLCVVVLLVARTFDWLFGGTLALERTSGRAGWQSVLGRCLVWLTELCGAELFRQFAVWVSIERDLDWAAKLRQAGVFVLDAAEAEGLLGPGAFLSALCMTFGVCAAALAVALLSRSGRRRHKANLVAGYTNLLWVGPLIWLVWYLTRVPLTILGAAAIVVGLPLSCYLLECKVE